MSERLYTPKEARNLEALHEWVRRWNSPELLPSFIDDSYAQSCEVFIPLEKTHWVKPGGSKENFKRVEIEAAKLYARREMQIVQALAVGDTVAVEAKVTWHTRSGKSFETWFAAFLTFDADGKIKTDHTFHPEIKGTLPPALKAALDQIAADQ